MKTFTVSSMNSNMTFLNFHPGSKSFSSSQMDHTFIMVGFFLLTVARQYSSKKRKKMGKKEEKNPVFAFKCKQRSKTAASNLILTYPKVLLQHANTLTYQHQIPLSPAAQTEYSNII